MHILHPSSPSSWGLVLTILAETSTPITKLTDTQADTMSVPSYCHHSFNLLKSESTLIQWTCAMCHTGLHWYIFECKYCRLKTCRPCTNKV
ncbi:hypothetical protein LZ554_005736 [Drepanopeziza brunnea f. sp. 'monogermtubi']|nr:hypothetical protein LZ554_005736 [Drepanopeziza brunnea f. sp. 'monogermtubi']